MSEAMTVITARQRWLKTTGTLTSIHTTWILVVSQVFVLAPLGHQVEKITLDITTQGILYTDVRREIMLQRSGGLENSKFFNEREQTSSTQ